MTVLYLDPNDAVVNLESKQVVSGQERQVLAVAPLQPTVPAGSSGNMFDLLTDNSGVKTYTPPAGTVHKILVQAIGGDARYTINGQSPTVSFGFLIQEGLPPQEVLLPVGKDFRVFNADPAVPAVHVIGQPLGDV